MNESVAYAAECTGGGHVELLVGESRAGIEQTLIGPKVEAEEVGKSCSRHKCIPLHVQRCRCRAALSAPVRSHSAGYHSYHWLPVQISGWCGVYGYRKEKRASLSGADVL